MYGKIFSSLFTGSMYGAGSAKFALMGYVIANMKPDKTVGFQVELNVKDLASRIGETQQVIQEAIDFLCSPDPESRSEAEEGRRLVKIGAFDYKVVNGVKYDQIRNEEERREKNRIRQEKFRKKQSLPPDEGPDQPPKTTRFTPPTLEEVNLLAGKSAVSLVEAEKFFNYYSSNGWRVGKNPMKNWHMAFSNWKLNIKSNGQNTRTNPAQRVDRSVGTLNEGIASRYAGLGKVAQDGTVQRPGS